VLRNQEEARASWSSYWRPAARVAAAGDGATWQGGEKPAGSGERRVDELEGQVERVERRGVAGSPGDCRRGAAGGATEQQRGRGERKMTGTCSQFFKSARVSL
jgi:hypothetical protein